MLVNSTKSPPLETYTLKELDSECVVVAIVQLLSRVYCFVTPWTAAHQASLSFTVSQSLLKLIFIDSVMPSNHLILCCLLLLLPSIFPSIRVFSSGQFFATGGQSIAASTSASVLPMYIQDWLSLGSTGLGNWPWALSPCSFFIMGRISTIKGECLCLRESLGLHWIYRLLWVE